MINESVTHANELIAWIRSMHCCCMCCACTEGDVWASAAAGGAAGAEQSCGGAAGGGGARGARPESLWFGSAASDRSSAGRHDHLWTSASDPVVSTSRDQQVRGIMGKWLRNRCLVCVRNALLGFSLFTHTSGSWASFSGVWSHYELVSWSRTHSNLTLMDHNAF